MLKGAQSSEVILQAVLERRTAAHPVARSLFRRAESSEVILQAVLERRTAAQNVALCAPALVFHPVRACRSFSARCPTAS